MNRFASMFVPGALKVPERLPKSMRFCASAKFEAPRELILSAYNTAVENQGSLPYCAAYSASSYAENLLWRKRGYQTQIDPVPLYRHAKTIDGDPDGDGTTIDAVLEALVKLGYFDGTKCKVKTFGGMALFGNASALRDAKFVVHKYGVGLVGLNIDTSWYTPKKGVVLGGGDSLGGHCVTLCGYDEGGFVILNSWSPDWGRDGFAYIPNSVFEKQFMYGGILTNSLDGLN